MKRLKQTHYLKVVRGKKQISLGNAGQYVGALKKVDRDSAVISMGVLNIRELKQIIQKKMVRVFSSFEKRIWSGEGLNP